MGFVGGALYKGFLAREQNIVGYDKYKNIGSFEDVLDTDIVFLCLPTPYVEDHGFDISALQSVCKELADNMYFGLVVLKSTVEPGTTRMLSETYGLNVAHNPEFLTARTADKDFDEQKHIVLGFYDRNSKMGGTRIIPSYPKEALTALYLKTFPGAEISVCSSEESESMKLFVNSFYAVKVQMFNEFYLLCQKSGSDFSKVTELMLKNGWINPMHTLVPGPDGQLSYGGACFPKDTNALNQFMKKVGSPHEVLEACIKERNKMRKD